MKAIEIVFMAEKMMERMSKADIRMNDWRWLSLWDEYGKAVERGEKVSVVVLELAERYGLSEAGVWRVIRRFKKEV